MAKDIAELSDQLFGLVEKSMRLHAEREVRTQLARELKEKLPPLQADRDLLAIMVALEKRLHLLEARTL